MQELAIIPHCSAGHSLGEISALTCSGAIDFNDALQIVRIRGQLMQQAAAETIAMAVIDGLDRNQISEMCDRLSTNSGTIVVACHNSEKQTVISGDKQKVEKAVDELEALGAICTLLNVSGAFHSPLMASAALQFRQELEKYNYKDLKWPVISNVTALPYRSKDDIIDNLTSQMVQPVQWQQSIKYMKNDGITTVVELGSQNVLKNLNYHNDKEMTAYAFELDNDRQELLKQLLPLQAKSMENSKYFITRCMAIAVCTKNNNWNEQEYQKGVVEPYRRIQQIQVQLAEKNEMPSEGDMRNAFGLLKIIFDTKKTPIEEQIERFQQIFNETGTQQIFYD